MSFAHTNAHRTEFMNPKVLKDNRFQLIVDNVVSYGELENFHFHFCFIHNLWTEYFICLYFFIDGQSKRIWMNHSFVIMSYCFFFLFLTEKLKFQISKFFFKEKTITVHLQNTKITLKETDMMDVIKWLLLPSMFPTHVFENVKSIWKIYNY